MSEGWSLTESGTAAAGALHSSLTHASLSRTDPGIFTGLLKELGVKGLEVAELYGLEPELLEEL